MIRLKGHMGTKAGVDRWGVSHRVCGVIALCVAMALLLTPWMGWAQADEHVVAPTARRESGETASNKDIGSAQCLSCHKWVASQLQTGMGMAAYPPGAAPPLNYDAMSFQNGGYTVKLRRVEGGSLQMTAAGEQGSLSVPVRWIFGQGKLGQTFILEHEGKLYESRASYYRATQNLDLTIGHAGSAPGSLLAALGRPLGATEVAKCFSCHTSEDVFGGVLSVAKAHPGVTCENCHGAGSEHAARMLSGRAGSGQQATAIFNPGTLVPADLNDFCGTCHRTTQAVLESGVRDVRNVRFQPYRLENSRCFDPSDARSTCIACHDPHRELAVSAASYDDKCLACHARRGALAVHAKAPACPKADSLCVNCHMPKVELPGAHYAFTDHYIRVVQPGAPYPD